MPAIRIEPIKTLLIEDDERLGLLTKQFLELNGVIVEIATNGTDGERAAMKRQYDCILLDVRMPGMSGVDLHRRLMRDRYQLPTIFISAHSAGEAFGASPPVPRLLLKPFDEDALLTAIHDALQDTPIVRPRSR